jgi:peroxiredoxin
MPGFIEVREQYGEQGFEIIGIAIDEVESVRKFAANLGVNYPILHGQSDANIVASHYGNSMGMLPFSVMIDRQGKIQFARAGELTKTALEKELKKLL